MFNTENKTRSAPCVSRQQASRNRSDVFCVQVFLEFQRNMHLVDMRHVHQATRHVHQATSTAAMLVTIMSTGGALHGGVPTFDRARLFAPGSPALERCLRECRSSGRAHLSPQRRVASARSIEGSGSTPVNRTWLCTHPAIVQETQAITLSFHSPEPTHLYHNSSYIDGSQTIVREFYDSKEGQCADHGESLLRVTVKKHWISKASWYLQVRCFLLTTVLRSRRVDMHKA